MALNIESDYQIISIDIDKCKKILLNINDNIILLPFKLLIEQLKKIIDEVDSKKENWIEILKSNKYFVKHNELYYKFHTEFDKVENMNIIKQLLIDYNTCIYSKLKFLEWFKYAKIDNEKAQELFLETTYFIYGAKDISNIIIHKTLIYKILTIQVLITQLCEKPCLHLEIELLKNSSYIIGLYAKYTSCHTNKYMIPSEYLSFVDKINIGFQVLNCTLEDDTHVQLCDQDTFPLTKDELDKIGISLEFIKILYGKQSYYEKFDYNYIDENYKKNINTLLDTEMIDFDHFFSQKMDYGKEIKFVTLLEVINIMKEKYLENKDKIKTFRDFLIYLYETMKCSTENDNLKYFIIEIFNSFGKEKNKKGFNKPILLNKIYTRPDM